MMTHLPTREIASSDRNGEPDTNLWQVRLRRYGPIVYGYARKQGLPDVAAADLTSTVLRDVTRTDVRTGHTPDSMAFGDRVYTLTRRACNSLLSARTGRLRPGRNGASDSAPEGKTDPVWEAEWLRRLAAEAMDRVKHEFSPPTWQAFWMTTVEGRSPAVVGKELAMTAGAVHVAKCQVLARLREEAECLRVEA